MPTKLITGRSENQVRQREQAKQTEKHFAQELANFSKHGGPVGTPTPFHTSTREWQAASMPPATGLSSKSAAVVTAFRPVKMMKKKMEMIMLYTYGGCMQSVATWGGGMGRAPAVVWRGNYGECW